jgi:N-succinyldiaminopimelate aminotransferase
MYESLSSIGFNPIKPDGGYFIVCNIEKFKTQINGDFSSYLTKEAGVTSIPMRAFYEKSSHGLVEKYVRFAFCKDKELLVEADSRLQLKFH